MRIVKDTKLSNRIRCGHAIAGVAAVASIFYGIWDGSQCHPKWKALIFAFWAVGIPFWFAVEFFYIYDKNRDASLEELKFAQEVATKVWIAISVVLAGLYFGKDGLHLP